ncbi:uncharacterized protein TrAtP1_001514 [Trichoderma atroviride]|uniref:uncharacterized protein n=1 Tax=Hypocrea atroviridis TaxID=63577 RepID=UPI003323AC96|nr:hypothetical protein TrAtP1_001514 [Trichoderma atroviride]
MSWRLHNSLRMIDARLRQSDRFSRLSLHHPPPFNTKDLQSSYCGLPHPSSASLTKEQRDLWDDGIALKRAFLGLA